MMRLIAAVIASVTLVGTGLLHGYWTDRWQKPPELAEAGARLNQIPTTLGEWELQETESKPPAPDPKLAGSLQRQYLNRRTGQRVAIYVVCGRFGPVSIHNPEVCYDAGGYMVGEKTRSPAPNNAGEFWTTDAVRTNATEEKKIRIYWAWNADNGWVAPGDARSEFKRVPLLHKLYVVRDLNTLDESRKGDPCLEFMQLLLPQMDRVLFNRGS